MSLLLSCVDVFPIELGNIVEVVVTKYRWTNIITLGKLCFLFRLFRPFLLHLFTYLLRVPQAQR